MQCSGVRETLDRGVLGKEEKTGSWRARWPTSAQTRSELRASGVQGPAPSALRETRPAEPGHLRVAGVGRGRREGCPWVAPEPGSGISIPSDEAEGAQSSQGNSSTAHLCMFYNGVDKIPMEPWSMCEEFPPEI